MHVWSFIFEVSSTFTIYSSHNPSKFSLDLNSSKSKNSHYVPYAHINTQLNKSWLHVHLTSFSHNPLMGFTTWLGRISSGPAWTLSSNNLLNSHMIYEEQRSELPCWAPSPNISSGHNWTSALESIVVSDYSTTVASEAEDNCNPPTVTSEFYNIYTLPTRSAWNITWASLKTFIRSPFKLKQNPFPCRALREMRLYLDLGTWWTLKE